MSTTQEKFRPVSKYHQISTTRLWVTPWFLFVSCLMAGESVPLEQEALGLATYLTFFKDSENLGPQDLVDQNLLGAFRPVGKRPLAVGYSNASWWLTFSTINSGPETVERFLVLDATLLDHIDLFVYDHPPGPGSQPVLVKQGGDSHPVSSRDYRYRAFVFALTLPPSLEHHVFLRIRSQSSVTAPLDLVTRTELNRRARNDASFLGFFFGALLVMSLYNFILGFRVKDRNYFLLAGVALSSLFTVLVLKGWAFLYLWPESPNWANHCVVFSYIPTGLFCLRFSQSLLEIHRFIPRLESVYDGLFILSLGWLALTPVLPYQLENLVGVLICSTFAGLVLGSALVCWRRGQPKAPYFLVATSVYIPGVMMYTFAKFALLPNSFLVNQSFFFGLILLMIIMSLVLGHRIKKTKHEGYAAEGALRESENRFELFMKNLSGAAVIWDEHDRITFENKYSQKLFGSLVGQRPQDYLPAKIATTILARDHHVLETGQPSRHIEPVPFGDRVVHFLATRFPLPSKEGKPILAGMAFDVTELIKTQRALKEANNRLEERVVERTAELQQAGEVLSAVLDNIPHGIFWKDRQSVYQGCNRHLLEAGGFKDAAAIIGRTDFDLPWPAGAAQKYRHQDQKIINKGESILNLEGHFYKNGQLRDMMVNKVPMRDSAGEITGIIGFSMDTTELQKLRRVEIARSDELRSHNRHLETKNVELLRSQKQVIAQLKMAFLGTLSSGLAHEIYNPLNFVMNLGQLSSDYMEELRVLLESNDTKPENEITELFDKLATNLGSIQNHSEKATLAIAKVSEFSKGSSHTSQSSDINSLVSQFSRANLLGVSTKGITIQKNYAPETGRLELVAYRIGQVIIYLMRNAIESVSARMALGEKDYNPGIWLETRALSHLIEIGIRDNGEGIPPNNMQKIFEPLFSTRPPGSGNIGMGLTISKDIVVDEHRGQLEVEQGDGFVTFLVRLPRAGRC